MWPCNAAHAPEKIRSNSASHTRLALTVQNSCNNLHVLVDDLPNKVASQASGVQDFVDDTFWTSDQRFLGKPRVTLGDSIELSSIVTSPGPFQPEELDLPLKVPSPCLNDWCLTWLSGSITSVVRCVHVHPDPLHFLHADLRLSVFEERDVVLARTGSITRELPNILCET